MGRRGEFLIPARRHVAEGFRARARVLSPSRLTRDRCDLRQMFFIVTGTVEVVCPYTPKSAPDKEDDAVTNAPTDKAASRAGRVAERAADGEKGKPKLPQPREVRVALLSDNQFFGERAMIAERERRTATCRALVFVETRVLTRADFLEVSIMMSPRILV